jgi:hypothetical protein
MKAHPWNDATTVTVHPDQADAGSGIPHGKTKKTFIFTHGTLLTFLLFQHHILLL